MISTSVICRGSKSIRRSASPTRPARSSATIHPSSTISSSITRPPTSVARTTAVYFRLGTPLATRNCRHSSGRTLARRLRGGVFECMTSPHFARLHVRRGVHLVGGFRVGPHTWTVNRVPVRQDVRPVAKAVHGDEVLLHRVGFGVEAAVLDAHLAHPPAGQLFAV